MNWEKKKLKDCCISIADGDHQPPPKSENGVPFVTIANIDGNNFDFSNTMFAPETYYNSLDGKRKAQIGDVLYSVVGSFGIPVLIKEAKKFVFQRHIAILRCNKDVLLPEYLYYTMLTRDFYMKADTVALGAAQRTISLTSLRNLEINVPPLELQERIVDKVRPYDDLIENNRRQIKLLEEAAQRLYKEWFVDLRFPDWETTPISDGVPEGWSMQTVEELSCVLRRGISPRYNEKAKYMVINQKCIRQAVMDMSEARHQEKAYPDELNLQDGDVVICSTGTGTLGRVGQVYGNYANTTFDSHVTLVRAATDTGTQFLYQAIKSNQAYLMGCGKGSTNQQELNKDVIKAVKLLVPTDKLLSTFENQAQAIHNKIRNLRDQTSLAAEARDHLLPKLMSGEIEL